ncbi:MAG: leucine-rich repeat protein [Clostridia bacterium]|nr:leucine-rich repeat protein [Clostridia bacterium]
MKKLFCLITAVILAVSMSVTSLAAPTYGSEWDGYYQVAPTRFSDVPSTHWAYNAIMQVYQKNWFSGYPDGSFRPNASITRAEALKVFVVFLGLDYQSVDLSNLSYSDISASDWYAAYVEAGKDLFPVHTTIQGKTPFNPNMPVTREDTIYALVKALGCDVDVKYPDQSVLNMFSDKSSISGSIKDEFAIALTEGLVSGFPDGTIRAQAALTRAEFATLLLRGTEHGFHDRYQAKISTVTVTPANNTEMTVGETITLSARATYTDGTNQPYTSLSPYDASGNGVVSVNGTKITALKEGKAEIKYNDSYLKNETLTIIVKNPTDAPVVKVTGYDEITEEESMTVSGTVTDKNGSVDLTCNGKDVSVNSDGSFKTTVALKVGRNEIKFVATNIYGLETEKTIVIEREKAEEEKPVVPTDDGKKEEDDKKTPSSSTTVSGEDGTPYLTFDKETGTITKCGTSAADIEIPEKIEGVNVYNIGEGAFADCTYLESIEFPSTLKSIKADAFSGCIRLVEVEIPEGVTSIGAGAFYGCVSLTDVIIPEGVKKIADETFFGCKRLVNISLPEGLRTISASAFDGCKSLTEIELPESTTKIENGAFTDCGSLKKIVIPDSVTSIADDAFNGCNAITIYASVNSYAIEYAKEKGIAWEII